ncbi:MAG: DmsC/YnfH family molybdoenzyme membrane anchor subunit [Aromatoleum sp.]|jgi:formate-dependent nitrite reductase membrane component NrfD|uniref:DmsC/YnfH family molybdoenzyme membrane anchor subunit n=1 Tax=Aromatoleum sp. TaxID=2307007 RepID=UPI002894F5ED|nr:DmsC/YnfH family molybdoenzyme membrane anchor subunit [Aromatoleum sp.]MDT3669473.1 DmsC/YnfH family molybdoenzyme membrane anchor subunit [Aromatoleum sp.]
MTQSNDRLVGNSFRPGYRFQRYWDTSMALAFFFAEVGAGLFVVSLFLDLVPGMVLGLALAATLKPYFHLAHMGVPKKSWRAIARPDRSWVSRGAIAVGVLVATGALHILAQTVGVGLPPGVAAAIRYAALAAGIVVMCYQGFAMSASEAFALWASPLLPVASFLYASTAGVLLASIIGALAGHGPALAPGLIALLLVADLAVVAGILVAARRKSKGGAFSAELLLKGRYVRDFVGGALGVGLVLPLVAVVAGGDGLVLRIGAALAMLIGFFAFRLLMLRAAVYEPITHELAASIGLPARS